MRSLCNLEDHMGQYGDYYITSLSARRFWGWKYKTLTFFPPQLRKKVLSVHVGTENDTTYLLVTYSSLQRPWEDTILITKPKINNMP